MDINKLRNAIKKRESIPDEWYDGVKRCHSEMLEVIGTDPDGAVLYLMNDCTENEFSWLSEIFDEIAQETNSRAIINALYALLEKYPDESEKYNIRSFVESAELFLNE